MTKTKSRSVFVSVVVIVLLAMAAFCIYQLLPDSVSASNTYQESDYHTIKENDKVYNYNTSLVNILFLGIDSTDGSTTQSDTIDVVVLDRKNETTKIISLSRDTMCDVRLFDLNHNDLGWDYNHLGIQFSYGIDYQNGAMLTSQAVSRLMMDIPMNYYVAMNLSSLTDIQNIVGDLTLVCPNDSLADYNPEWTTGATITINSDNVELFVRKRDIEVDYSNTSRMQRQQAYLDAYFVQLQSCLNTDFEGTVEKLYSASQSMTMNITLADIEAFANMILSYSYDSNSDFLTLKGLDRKGANHDEFIYDEESLKNLILNIYYEEG